MIPLMKNAFLNEYETKDALAEFIRRSGRLSMDEKCREFEQAFSRWQGRSEAILFNSGGSANLSLLQSLLNMGRLKVGDRVGFSSLTWSTNIMPIIQMGMTPVPIDCSPKTLNVMSEDLLRTLRTDDLVAVFLTNALGFAGDLEIIRRLCDERGILVLEDNCESLGTELAGGKAGNFSLGSTFSFFVAHHMSTIEGGMVCTDDGDLAEMLRIVRANGWDRNLTASQQQKWRKRHGISSEFDAKYTFYDLGYNVRPTEITGFLGLAQLKYLDENINIREQNFMRMEKVVGENPDLQLLERAHIRKLSPFALPVVCRNPDLRTRYLAQFAGAGIEIRPMIAGNIQRQPFYRKYVKTERELPGAEFLHHNAFYCGNYPDLSETDLETIASSLNRIG